MSALSAVPPNDAERWEGQAHGPCADFQGLASTTGAEFKHHAADYVLKADATILRSGRPVSVYTVDLEIQGKNGITYGILAHGAFDDDNRPGLERTDTVKKMGFDVWQLRRLLPDLPLLVVTSHLPRPGGASARQLADISDAIIDVVATKGDLAGYLRLRDRLHGPHGTTPLELPWLLRPPTVQPGLFDGRPTDREEHPF